MVRVLSSTVISSFISNFIQGLLTTIGVLLVPFGVFTPKILEKTGLIDIQSHHSSANTDQHQYSTEILSVEPLVVYINNFVSESEIKYLLALG